MYFPVSNTTTLMRRFAIVLVVLFAAIGGFVPGFAPTSAQALTGSGKWVNLGLSDENVYGLGLSRVDDLFIYAGTNEGQRGIFKTTDGGKTWLPFNNGLGELDLQNIAVEFNGTDSIAYASSIYSQHVWKTIDGVGVVCGLDVGLKGTEPTARASAAAAFAIFIFSSRGSSLYSGNLVNVPSGPDLGARLG